MEAVKVRCAVSEPFKCAAVQIYRLLVTEIIINLMKSSSPGSTTKAMSHAFGIFYHLACGDGLILLRQFLYEVIA